METFFESEKVDDAALKSSFESKLKKLSAEITVCKDKQKEIDKRSITSELKRKTLSDDLRCKESKLRDCEDKLLEFDECITSVEDIDRFEEIHDSLELEHKIIVEEKGYLNGVDKTFSRFLVRLESSTLKENHDSSCPVCLRCYKNQDELDDTIRELKKSTSKIPQKLNEVEAKIEISKTRLEKLRSLKPEKQLYDEIKNEELKKIRKELENYDKNILPKLKAESKANDDQFKRLEKLKTCSESLQNELVLVDKYLNECKDLEKKINDKQKNSISMEKSESLEILVSKKGNQN